MSEEKKVEEVSINDMKYGEIAEKTTAMQNELMNIIVKHNLPISIVVGAIEHLKVFFLTMEQKNGLQ
jgi:hypothetical protein